MALRLASAVVLAACAGGSAFDEPPDARAPVMYGDAVVQGEDAGEGRPPILTFRNPLNTSADPFMVVHAGHYYLTTTQGTALRLWKAASLAELATAPSMTIWADADSSRNKNMWAPSMYLVGGRWYVYYTADDGVDEHHRLYVIESESDDPMGPYHFKAKLEPPGATGLFAIDPVVLEQAGGRYMLWSGAGSEGHNLIYIAPMSNPWTIAGPRTYLPAQGGCSEVREAPSIVQRAGTTFLVYSTCDTGKPDYQLWMLSIPMARNPMVAANWTQHPQRVFGRNDSVGAWGPGSNDFFKSPDGTEDWLVYHAKNTTQFTYNSRTTRAQRITWVNDVPMLGAPVAAGATQDVPSGDPGRGSYFINDDGTTSGAGSVTFSSGWTYFPNCGVQCFDGDDHGSSQPNATATFTFEGTQIALYSVRDAGNGIGAFSIDGGPETTADYYASIRQGEQALYVSGKLPFGQHELRVRVTGTHNGSSAGSAISIDRAEIFVH